VGTPGKELTVSDVPSLEASRNELDAIDLALVQVLELGPDPA